MINIEPTFSSNMQFHFLFISRTNIHHLWRKQNKKTQQVTKRESVYIILKILSKITSCWFFLLFLWIWVSSIRDWNHSNCYFSLYHLVLIVHVGFLASVYINFTLSEKRRVSLLKRSHVIIRFSNKDCSTFSLYFQPINQFLLKDRSLHYSHIIRAGRILMWFWKGTHACLSDLTNV